MSAILAKYIMEANRNLSNIAATIGLQTPSINSWSKVRQVVSEGVAPTIFPVGSQLSVEHSTFGTLTFDVVAHDYMKSITDANAHTMTILTHGLPLVSEFCPRQALYSADSPLPAGTYTFRLALTLGNWTAGTYQFTTTQSLPKNGQFVIEDGTDTALASCTIKAYSSATATSATESVSITAGDSGTSLGTLGTELNHAYRVAHGSNNYKESAVRQLINSTSGVGNAWTQQNKYDRPPSWKSTKAGFAHGLDGDFLAVVGAVAVPCVSSNWESSSTTPADIQYTVNDKFYLPSFKEIFGFTPDGNPDTSIIYPYYVNATDAERIKRYGSLDYAWHTRTPVTSGYAVQCVNAQGSCTALSAKDLAGATVACTIV